MPSAVIGSNRAMRPRKSAAIFSQPVVCTSRTERARLKRSRASARRPWGFKNFCGVFIVLNQPARRMDLAPLEVVKAVSVAGSEA